MARRRRRYSGKRKYKQVFRHAENVGSAGNLNSFAYIESIDPTNVRAMLNNVNVSAILNDGDGDNGGMMFYATRNATFDNDDIMCAKAMPGFGGTISLPCKYNFPLETTGDSGATVHQRVYLWIEVTDLSYTSDVVIPIVMEAWGWGHKIVPL